MSDEVWGFTGTRGRLTVEQMNWFTMVLMSNRPSELRHGACVNADEFAHYTALGRLGNNIQIFVHPPADGRLMMTPNWNHPNVDVLPHKPYHQRNRDLVNGIPAHCQKPCDRIIALPNGPWRPLGGTWYTVDFARGKKDRHMLKRVVPVSICYPDGKLEWDE